MANSIRPKEKLSSTSLPFRCTCSLSRARTLKNRALLSLTQLPGPPVPLPSVLVPKAAARGIWLWVLNLAARMTPSAIWSIPRQTTAEAAKNTVTAEDTR